MDDCCYSFYFDYFLVDDFVHLVVHYFYLGLDLEVHFVALFLEHFPLDCCHFHLAFEDPYYFNFLNNK